MGQWLKQSTSHTFRLGPFVDATDGFTPETSLSIADTDILLSKFGGTLAAKSDTTDPVHDAQGYYMVVLNATDTGTLGTLLITCYVSGARTVSHEFMVVPAGVYDGLVGGGLLTLAAGVKVQPASVSGIGIEVQGYSTNPAMSLSGGGTGLYASGASEGIYAYAGDSGGIGLRATGYASGILATGVTTHGISCITSGAHGLYAQGGNGDGIKAYGSNGLHVVAFTGGTGSGVRAVGGANGGIGLHALGYASAPGANFQGGASGSGLHVDSGSSSGYGLRATGVTADVNFSSGGGLDAAGVRSAIGMSAANLDAQLGAIDDYIDTEVSAIKAKTDFLPSVAAGSAGGLFIAGSNAATSITTALTANITGNLSGSVGSLGTQAKDDVNAEVDRALDTVIPSSPTPGSINALIDAWSSIRPEKNVGYANFMFPMFDAATKTPKTGLAVSGYRAIDGNPFAPCSNAVSELGNGVYRINLSASDLNGDKIMLRFVASQADDQLIELFTQG